MLLENLRPIKVLTDEEVKKELYRLNQKKVLTGVSIATGGMALYRLCQVFSASVDGFAQNSSSYIATKFTKEMTKKVTFPYVCSLNIGTFYLSATGLIVILLVAMIIGKKIYKTKTTDNHTVFEVCCIFAPIVAWILMEVFI